MTRRTSGQGRPTGRPKEMPRAKLSIELLEARCVPSANVVDLSSYAMSTNQFDSSQILVQFKNGSGNNLIGQSDLAGTKVASSFSLVSGLYDVTLSGGVSPAQALAAYGSDPRVAAVSLDYEVKASSVPNDPSYSQQWDLTAINAANAWTVTTGSSSVVIGVLDTGIDYNQPDLYDNIWINQAEIPASRLKNLVDVYHDGYISFADLNNPINQGPGKITDVNKDGVIDAADILAPMILDKNGNDTGLGGWAYAGNTRDGDTAHPNDFIGWNFVANTNNPFDDNGHGTHVSGTIGATTNNGVGIAGIDQNAQLMSLKFLDGSGNGNLTNFLSALSYSLAAWRENHQ